MGEHLDGTKAALKENPRIQRSTRGIAFCGYRITPGALRLSRRKQRRYRQRRLAWEAAWRAGKIDGSGLQRAYAAVHSITAHAHSSGWRRGHLARHPAVEV